jgi:hypothetical protein
MLGAVRVPVAGRAGDVDGRTRGPDEGRHGVAGTGVGPHDGDRVRFTTERDGEAPDQRARGAAAGAVDGVDERDGGTVGRLRGRRAHVERTDGQSGEADPSQSWALTSKVHGVLQRLQKDKYEGAEKSARTRPEHGTCQHVDACWCTTSNHRYGSHFEHDSVLVRASRAPPRLAIATGHAAPSRACQLTSRALVDRAHGPAVSPQPERDHDVSVKCHGLWYLLDLPLPERVP